MVLKSVYAWNFAVTDQGVYFIPDEVSPIQFLNFITGRVERIAVMMVENFR